MDEESFYVFDDVKLYFCSPEFVSSEKSTQWIRILCKKRARMWIWSKCTKKKRETQIHPTITLLYLFACVDGKFTTLLLLHICMTAKNTRRERSELNDMRCQGGEKWNCLEKIWFDSSSFSLFSLSAIHKKNCGVVGREWEAPSNGVERFSSNHWVEKHGKKYEKRVESFFIICLV